MADQLSDIVLRPVGDREPPSAYNRESSFQALKSSLDESPPDPLCIDASKILLLLPPNTPSTHLFSPHQAIQQALALADTAYERATTVPKLTSSLKSSTTAPSSWFLR